MCHLVAERAHAEVVRARPRQLQVEGIYPFAVEVNIAVIQAPFVRPQQVVPSGIGAANHKADIVHVVVIVHVDVYVGRHRTVGVHPVHGTLQQGEFALHPYGVVGIAVGVGHRVKRLVIAARMVVLVGENGAAARCRVVLGDDAQVMVAGMPEIVIHRNGTCGAVVEHGVYRTE